MTALQALVPDLPRVAPPGANELAGELFGWLMWGVLAAGIIGILMLVSRSRNRSATAYGAFGDLAWLVGGVALASVAALLVGAFEI